MPVRVKNNNLLIAVHISSILNSITQTYISLVFGFSRRVRPATVCNQLLGARPLLRSSLSVKQPRNFPPLMENEHLEGFHVHNCPGEKRPESDESSHIIRCCCFYDPLNIFFSSKHRRLKYPLPFRYFDQNSVLKISHPFHAIHLSSS